jgi:lysophospholipase L1-like esterase
MPARPRQLWPALTLAVLLVVAMSLLSPSSAGSKTKALFFGDSLFAGTGTSPKRPVEATETAKRLGWAPTVDAVGGTGWTTGGKHGKPYLERLQRDGRLGKHFDVVVLEGGTNDALYGDIDRIPEAVAQVVALVHDRQPGARIVLVGGFAPAGHDSPRFQQTDGVLATTATELGLQYVSQLRYHELKTGFLSHDHFHPGRRGYQRMAADLARALSAVPARP